MLSMQQANPPAGQDDTWGLCVCGMPCRRSTGWHVRVLTSLPVGKSPGEAVLKRQWGVDGRTGERVRCTAVTYMAGRGASGNGQVHT
jgi:hypothetical protein